MQVCQQEKYAQVLAQQTSTQLLQPLPPTCGECAVVPGAAQAAELCWRDAALPTQSTQSSTCNGTGQWKCGCFAAATTLLQPHAHVNTA